MEDVKDPQAVTNQPEGEVTPQPSAEGEPKTPETPVVPENTNVVPEANPEIENYKQALKQEREMRKQFQRELAQFRGSNQQQEDPQPQQGIDPSQFEELTLKLAEYQLKEGVEDVLRSYPQLDKATQNAIRRNPRGFVNPGTMDINNALLDIADYVENYVTDEGLTSNTPQPRTVPIMGNNAPLQEDNQAAEIAEIEKIPAEDWTPEQHAAVQKFLANKNR